MSFLAPLFLLGVAAIAVPVFVHLIQRERKNIVEFPSLMFLQKIPYQSVERRRIHNWPLLLFRAAAMLLVVAAFARPFFNQDPVRASAVLGGAREVVVLLDRSASMGYGDHWSRAQAEAKKIVAGIGGSDRATLVLFDQGPEEAVRATSNAGALSGAIDAATVGSGATRYAPALRFAQSLLSRSALPRRELVLISDFQRSGWERQEEISLPEGTTVTPISVAELETADLAVSSIAIQRATFSGQERATITAGLTNRGTAPMSAVPVSLEIDGRVIGTRNVSLGANQSASVTFDAVTVPEANLQGAVRAGTDKLPKNNDFYFVLSPSRPLSVLVIQAEGAGRNDSLYLKTALDLGKAPPFVTEVVSAARVTPAQIENRAVVILNDSSTLSTAVANRLQQFVQQGGGLFVVAGERTPVAADWPVLAGTLGAMVDRTTVRGGTLGYLDYSHPVFEDFEDPRNGNFANMRFFRYRRLTTGPDDRVLGRFDDGGIALSERRVGSGRVILFTSTLDGDWNQAPRHVMFVPLVHEVTKYLAQFEEPAAWHTVGRMLDISSAVGSLVRTGQAGSAVGGAAGASGVVVSPSGTQTALGAGGVSSIELAEQGFYAVRVAGARDQRPFAVAVNLEPRESELVALQPADFLAGVTGRSPSPPTGESLDQPVLTSADMEKRQTIWWYLLVTGLAALLIETVVSNRLTRRSGVRLAS